MALVLSLTSFVSFRKRKGDEVDGMEEVAKKKSRKEKDKESKLEKALKVSPELDVSSRHSVSTLFLILGRKFKEVRVSCLMRALKIPNLIAVVK